ncbi:MAG: fibronectin type III domain-containing protein [Desulfobacteraceae bacterium]|nr:fibronectin type III domain-containing protein [Desulfobacteraceae bacterium]
MQSKPNLLIRALVALVIFASIVFFHMGVHALELTLAWDKNNQAEEIICYKIYWSRQPFSTATKPDSPHSCMEVPVGFLDASDELDVAGDIDENTAVYGITLDDLQPHETYHIAVTAVSPESESRISNCIEVDAEGNMISNGMTSKNSGMGGGSGGAGVGGSCFIQSVK